MAIDYPVRPPLDVTFREFFLSVVFLEWKVPPMPHLSNLDLDKLQIDFVFYSVNDPLRPPINISSPAKVLQSPTSLLSSPSEVEGYCAMVSFSLPQGSSPAVGPNCLTVQPSLCNLILDRLC